MGHERTDPAQKEWPEGPPRGVGPDASEFGPTTNPAAAALQEQMRRWLSRGLRTLRSDKFAVANVVMFMITAAIFLPAITVLVIYMQDIGDHQAPTSTSVQSRAASTLWQLTESEGRLTSGSTAWERSPNPHDLAEVGLHHSTRAALDSNKVEKLQGGGTQQDLTNGYLDYPEMKSALGLEHYDFYLRMHPIITDSISDPYAVGPIKGKHVAYVANLSSGSPYDPLDASTWDHRINAVSGEFYYPTATAQREIEALDALGLTTEPTNTSNGFSKVWYQPHSAVTPIPYLLNAYTNLGTVSGDIIADTERSYNNGTLTKTYQQWFWEYWEPSPGEFLYDAIIFGTDVDLDRWNTNTGRAELKSFLDAGGVVVLLGTDDYPDGFAGDCGGSADCLLSGSTSMQPLTIPDSSNPIVSEPNTLEISTYARKGSTQTYWSVCGNEQKGFLPVVLDSAYDPYNAASFGCSVAGAGHPVVLGVSASDRYNQNGVLVITSYDVTQGSASRVSEGARFFSNVLNYGLLRSAYLSYGPTLPDGHPVESVPRSLLVTTEQGEVVQVHMTLYMWRS